MSTRSESRSPDTLMNTPPASGSGLPPACWLFTKAMPGSWSRPITSPVDFISGVRRTSQPGNRANGSTASFTATWRKTGSFVNPISFSVWPAMNRAAMPASGTPVALLTNGTVREARGFTSKM